MDLSFPTGINLSQSELKTFERCKFSWYLKYITNLRSNSKGTPLTTGLIFHQILSTYHDPGFSAERTADPLGFALRIRDSVWSENVQEINQTDRIPLFTNLDRMLRGYVKEYTVDALTFLDTEIDFKVPVFNRDLLVGFIHGRIDAVVEDPAGNVWFLDHKTTKRFSFEHLDLDPQADFYSIAGGKLFGARFRGMIFDYIRTRKSTSSASFARVETIRNRAELHFAEENLAQKLIRLRDFGPHDIVLNFTKTCSWDCNFTGVCRRLRAGLPIESFLRSNFHNRADEEGQDEGEPEEESSGGF